MSRRAYTPRRQSKRWVDGDCPADVLCLLFAGPKYADCYTVFYRHVYGQADRSYLFGRGMSASPTHPQGVGMSFEMEPHQVAALRHRERSIRWSELPPDVQACIRRDCQPGGLGSDVET